MLSVDDLGQTAEGISFVLDPKRCDALGAADDELFAPIQFPEEDPVAVQQSPPPCPSAVKRSVLPSEQTMGLLRRENAQMGVSSNVLQSGDITLPPAESE